MPAITISLSEDCLLRLKELAEEANIPPEEWIRARVEECLARPTEDFRRATNFVLQKNKELYRRLA